MERTIYFSAVFNFRDIGGYAGLDGRTVRSGRVFRSDTLSRLCEDDREAFSALGVRTVLDLRRPYEVEREGSCPEWDGIIRHNIAPDHPEWDHSLYRDEDGPARFLADRYREFAETGRAGIAEALGLLAEQDNAPIVVHCVAGKDRTGVVSALTLSLLGVSDEDVAADYALTQENGIRFTEWLRVNRPAAVYRNPPLFYTATPPEAMLMFLDELRARHGSVERYAIGGGLHPKAIPALREHLLG